MKWHALALFSAAGLAAAQGVTQQIAPDTPAPAGCEASFAGNFEIAIVDVSGSSKRELDAVRSEKRAACTGNGIFLGSLSNTVLTDELNRTGYIASNYQFQFDGPPQAGAIYTAGFSVCSNQSLALGGSTVFYKCASGSFSNLYDRNWAAQCSPVYINIMPCDGVDPPGDAGEGKDGQIIVGTEMVTTTVVVPLSDGQPQVITTAIPVPMCQISDGQVQVHTTPCASVTVVATTTPSAAPASEYTDGQIQVTTPGSAPGGGSVTATPVTTPATTPETTPETTPVTTPLTSGGGSGGGSSANSTTLLTTPTPSTSRAGTTSTSTSSSAASTATSGADRADFGSVAALMISLLGATLLL